MKSGLLLVTGPYKVNGVPLKRVNQTYTLTTSTKVDIKGVDVTKIEDTLFKKEKKAKKAGESKFFAESAKVSTCLITTLSRSSINVLTSFCFYRRRKFPRRDSRPRKASTVPF